MKMSSFFEDKSAIGHIIDQALLNKDDTTTKSQYGMIIFPEPDPEFFHMFVGMFLILSWVFLFL